MGSAESHKSRDIGKDKVIIVVIWEVLKVIKIWTWGVLNIIKY